MARRRRVAHPSLRRAAALAYAALIFGFGVANVSQPVRTELPLDKLEHLLAFGGFVWVLELALLELRPWSRRMLAVLVSSLAGLGLELVQSALPHRSAEVLDFVADASGALLAGALSALAAAWRGQRRRAAAPHGT